MNPPAVLRAGLLNGATVALATAGPSDHGRAVAAMCAGLGATVSELHVDPFGDPPQTATAGVLVWDGAGAFAQRTGIEAVSAALDGAWLAVRAGTQMEGGKVILLAPPPGDEHAAAARAGLENLARTLSIEWSRYGVRTVAVLPGAPADVATAVAYLSSQAGDYFSGTALELA